MDDQKRGVLDSLRQDDARLYDEAQSFISHGDLEAVCYLLDKGMDPNHGFSYYHEGWVIFFTLFTLPSRPDPASWFLPSCHMGPASTMSTRTTTPTIPERLRWSWLRIPKYGR